jgi:gliding motility-associated-like protein
LEIENKIDQLLSAKMDGFEAEPPASVWDSIQTDLQTTGLSNVAKPSSNTIINAVKSISTFGKLVVAVGAIAVGSISYYLINKETVEPTAGQSVQKNVLVFGSNQNDAGLIENAKGFEEDSLIVKSSKKSTNKISKTIKPSLLVDKSQEAVSLFIEPRIEDLPAKQIGTKDQVKKEIVIPAKDVVPAGNQIIDIEEPLALEKETLDFADLTEKRQPKFYNVISPNGDGKNDTWFVEIDEIAEYHLSIYDLKGQLVFESDKVSEHWKGENLNTGEICHLGKYAFIINYKYKNETKMNTNQGLIMLFR